MGSPVSFFVPVILGKENFLPPQSAGVTIISCARISSCTALGRGRLQHGRASFGHITRRLLCSRRSAWYDEPVSDDGHGPLRSSGMIKQLAQEILEEQLFARDDRVVVAVSGGPDSMALMLALVELNRHHGWTLGLHVAHLNHSLRGQAAEDDAEFVQGAAQRLGVPCTIDKRDVNARAAADGLGVEEAGRKGRFEFLHRVCLNTESRVVAVGHHADDNAETILHRILRGTGLRGLSGIPRSRALAPTSEVRIVRPLLRWRRSQILAYLNKNRIAFRDDESNKSEEPMRNRLRQTILPLLEQRVNPQVRDALIRLGEQAEWLEEFLGESVQRTFETLIVSRNDQQLVLNADVLARKSRIVQTELIRLGYRAFGLGEQDLGFTHLVTALELVADKESGRRAVLPHGLSIEKRYHQLIFSLPTEVARESISPEIAVCVPGTTLLPLRRLSIECSVTDVPLSEIANLKRAGGRMQEYVNFEAVRPPLVIRTRKPGDRFCPLGAPGSKKVSDFLTSAKVDPRARENVAVLCDRLGPIWIIGHRIDERVKLTAHTKRVLGLTVTHLP